MDKIDREYLVSHTIEMMNKDVPKLANSKAVRELISVHFNRSNRDLHELFDSFFYAVIEGVCNHMRSKGIKQPSATDFITSFRQIQGFIINIGNLNIQSFTPTEEFKDRIKTEIIDELDKRYFNQENVEDREWEETEEKYDGWGEEEEEEEEGEEQDDGN